MAICAICADSPTVRSHVIPRALFHDSKRQGRTLIMGGVEPGHRVAQSGKWTSRILCAEHERQLGTCDDYGVAFCRAWRRSGRAGDAVVPNQRPALLVDFAVACMWRMAAAVSDGRPGRIMGVNADLIEGRLFGPGEGCEPAVSIEPFELDDGRGQPLVFGLLPSPVLPDRRSWHFIVSRLRFLADFDSSAAGSVNALSQVPLRVSRLRRMDEIAGLPSALARMAVARKLRR